MQRTFLLHRMRMGILPERQSIAIRDHRGEALFFRDPDGHCQSWSRRVYGASIEVLLRTTGDRGRDTSYPVPPAQIRTGAR